MTNEIKQVARAIEEGKIVSFPTETIYGIAANALDHKAVAKIYNIKGRNFKKPLALVVSDIKFAAKYVELNDKAIKLAKAFCPGPLSIVLPKKASCKIDGSVNANLDSFSIRIPNHKIALDILNEVSCPVVLTSANPSGEMEAVTADQVREYFGNKIDIILEGLTDLGTASTVVDLCFDEVKILREGTITLEQINKILSD